MLKRMMDTALRAPLLTVAAAGAVLAGAWFVLKTLPVDVFPELDVSRVVVQTEAGGLTAEEVEQFVTIPIESAMNGIPGVTAVRSSSGGGLSFVWIDFDWGSDSVRARYRVSERLAAVRDNLPKEVNPEITPVVSVTGEISLIALTAPEKGVSLMDLRALAEFDLRNRIMAIPGVGQVVVTGGRLPEFRIGVSDAGLRTLGLSLDDILASARASRTMASAGYLEHVTASEIPLRQTARADSIEVLRRAIIPGRQNLTLGQAATVEIAGAPRRGSASWNGEDAVLLAVQKAPGGNTLELTKKIHDVLETFRRSGLPKGAQLHERAYRQADFINLSIANGGRTVRDAVLIVIVVLGLTLLSVRTTLIVLASMPLSFALGILFFPALGLGINIMTLGGLAVAVGDVVDSAIIFVEIVWRRLRENAALPVPAETTAVVRSACAEVLPSVTLSTFLIGLVFAPLLLLSGIEGQFFRPLGATYLLVFAASLVVAVTLIPALCRLLGWGVRAAQTEKSGTDHAGDGRTARLLKRVYRPVLEFVLRHPIVICSFVFILCTLTAVLASRFGTSFLARFREDTFTVFVSTPPGTSLQETERIADGAVREIRAIDGVLSVARRTGRAEKDEHAEPVSASELFVRVDLERDVGQIRERIAEAIHRIPGVSTMIGYPIAHRISAVLSGTQAELAVNVFGDDLPVLRQTVHELTDEMAKIPGVADIQANREVLVDTLRIRYRPEELARYSLTFENAGTQVSAAFNGLVAGEVTVNKRRWDIVVRSAEAERDSIEDVRNFCVTTPDGARVPLSEIADIYREESSNLIARDNGQRKGVISCNTMDGANMGDLVKVLRERLDPIAARKGCTVSYGGVYAAQQSAARRLGALSAVLAILMFVLLTRATGGIRNAVLVMVNVPMGLIGGAWAVFLFSPAPLKNLAALISGGAGYIAPIVSVSSLVGFVTVAGFVVRGGLLLVNRYNELRTKGLDVRTVVLVGSQERMIPILMTSLTTVLGLLPLIWAADEPGGELLAPLAVVQFGGLISATLINLVLPPALYLLFNRERA